MFEPGELRKYVEVNIVDDGRYEADEEFYLYLEYRDDAVATVSSGLCTGRPDAVAHADAADVAHVDGLEPGASERIQQFQRALLLSHQIASSCHAERRHAGC